MIWKCKYLRTLLAGDLGLPDVHTHILPRILGYLHLMMPSNCEELSPQSFYGLFRLSLLPKIPILELQLMYICLGGA